MRHGLRHTFPARRSADLRFPSIAIGGAWPPIAAGLSPRTRSSPRGARSHRSRPAPSLSTSHLSSPSAAAFDSGGDQSMSKTTHIIEHDVHTIIEEEDREEEIGRAHV